jgi:hypothetical protein
MFSADVDITVLARAMIRNFPFDAADRAATRSSLFAALGRAETGRKWSLVSEEIDRILTDAAAS